MVVSNGGIIFPVTSSLKGRFKVAQIEKADESRVKLWLTVVF